MEKIGKVTLNYKYYNDNDGYSDGDYVEERILKACKEGNHDELLRTSHEYPFLYHLSDIRHNLIEWYNINKNEAVLEIGSGCGAVTGVLSRKAGKVDCIELSKRRSLINAYRNKNQDNIEIIIGNFQDVEPDLGKYDIITLIGVWEYSALYIMDSENPYIEMLKLVKRHLKKNGRLFIAIENKMGMKYFNGAFEDHTGKMYSGLNDYTDGEQVRTFSKNEIASMLNIAGYEDYSFYYPMPDYKLPEVIYSDRFLPQPGMIRDFGKVYDIPRYYNYLEATSYDQVCSDNMFPYFANSFVVTTGEKPDVIYAKYNRMRKPAYRTCTLIKRRDDHISVYKHGIGENENNKSLIESYEKNEKMSNSSVVKLAEGEIINGEYVTEFVHGPSLDYDFYSVRHDQIKFIELAKHYVDKYLTPDDNEQIPFVKTEKFISVFGDVEFKEELMAVGRCNIDLVFHNIRHSDKGVVAFDPEWIFDFPIPFEYPIWRALFYIYYEYYAYLKNLVSRERFIEQVGISTDRVAVFEKMEDSFIRHVNGDVDSGNYLLNYQKNAIMQTVRMY